MSIRNRTEISDAAARVAGLVGAAGVGGAAAVHAVWASGSTWPAASSDELADLVVGRRPMPGPPECAAVAVLLGGASLTTIVATTGGHGWAARRSTSLARLAARSLFARGAGGIVMEQLGIGEATPEFRRWNRRLYNPLCLTLAALVAIGSRRGGR